MYQRLADMIVRGELKPGEPLREVRLATLLGTSRLLAQTLEGLDRRVRWLYGFVRVDRIAEHDEILQALEERDARRAAAAVRHRIEETRRLFHMQMGGGD